MDSQREFQNQLWSLISKKLSKEATTQELDELQTILLNNPDLHHQVDMLTEMWQQHAKAGKAESEAAYVRHIMKHKDEFFGEESNDEIVPTPIPETNSSFFSKRKLTIFSFAGMIIISAVVVYLFNQKKSANPINEPVLSSVVTKNG